MFFLLPDSHAHVGKGKRVLLPNDIFQLLAKQLQKMVAPRPGQKRQSSIRNGNGSSGSTSEHLGNEAEEGKVQLSYPLSFAVTANEARSIQVVLAKLGFARPPPPLRSRSNSSTNPPTPSASYPSTPSSGLPRGASPFVPMTALTSIGNDDAIKQPEPNVQTAIANAFEDDVLPLTTRTSLRSFMIGYFIQSALQAILPGLLRRKSPGEAIRALFSATAAKTGFSFALFTFLYRNINYILTFVRIKALSSLPSLTPSSLPDSSHRTRFLAKVIRTAHGDGIVPFLSALAASPALYLLPSQVASKPGAATFPRKTFALDLFTKGLYFHVDALHRRRSSLVSWIPEWCDTALLYAIGNGQLLWTFLFEPDCFPKSYGDFILARSSAYVPARPKDLPASMAWPTRREIADHVALLSTPKKDQTPFPGFTSPSLAALNPSARPTTPFSKINPVLDWSPAHPAHSRLLCAMLHPTEPSCRSNYLHYWATEWKQSAKFVAAITAVFNLFKLRSWKRDPEGSLFRFVMSVCQGATVISGSIATAWAFTCLFQQYFPRNFIPRSRFFLNGFLSSIFIYAVPAARRAQLGVYVGRLSLDSTWQILAKQGKVKNVRNGDVALLAFGLAMLSSLYEDSPYILSGYVRRILRTLTGPRLSGTSAVMAGLPLKPAENTTTNQIWSSSSEAVNAKDLDTKLRNRF